MAKINEFPAAPNALADADLIVIGQDDDGYTYTVPASVLKTFFGLAFAKLAGDTMTGALVLPSGSTGAPSLAVGASDFGLYRSSNNMVLVGAGTELFSVGGAGWAQRLAGGGTLNATLEGEGTTQLTVSRISSNTAAPNLIFRKARGVIGAPTDVATNDVVAAFAAQAYGGGAYRSCGGLRVTITDPAPSGTSMAARTDIVAAAIGAVTNTPVAGFDHQSGITMFGTNTVIDNSRNHVLRPYLVATVPAAASNANRQILITNPTIGNARAFTSDGVNWYDGAGVILS